MGTSNLVYEGWRASGGKVVNSYAPVRRIELYTTALTAFCPNYTRPRLAARRDGRLAARCTPTATAAIRCLHHLLETLFETLPTV